MRRLDHELQYRDGLQPDGEWKKLFTYPQKSREEMLVYRDAANAKHPGRWRVLPVTIDEVEELVCTVEMGYKETYGEPLP